MTRTFLIPFITLAVGLLFSNGDSISDKNKPIYPEHLPGKFTGGFGEQTCHSCHFDYPLNFEEGSLQLEGLPEKYVQGQSYTLRIYVSRPGLQKAGFQLAARFPDSTQAGAFSINSNRIEFTPVDSGGVQYIQHSAEGTEPSADNKTAWLLEWTAPKDAASKVIFHVSGNAANGDASEFGDYVLTKNLVLLPTDN